MAYYKKIRENVASNMAAFFVLTVPTAAYEQKLLADRDKNVEDKQLTTPLPKGSVKGFLGLAPVQESTLLQNRRLDAGLKSSSIALESATTDQPVDEPGQSNFVSIASVLTSTLDELKVNDVVWGRSSNDKYYQVTFPSGKNNAEEILQKLRILGIGSIYDTKLSVLQCSLQYNSQDTFLIDNKVETSDAETDADTDGEKAAERKLLSKTSRNEFIQSIKSRLAVAQVVEGVRASAVLSFDFIMFVLLAGMLAALGLVENSSVILVASMLVSPMMGPILAGTFGTVIQDHNLQRLGVKTELIGLALCLTFGFAFGIVYTSIANWNDGFWLKDEMVARGQLRSLWVGVLIALPSGAGVALSVLGGNAGSLVGVAISASLLPPVVNSGLLWAAALTKYIEFQISNNSSVLVAPETYKTTYSDNMAEEALLLGAVSLCLTLLNIFCIVLMGVIVLKIKEVTPDKEAPNTRRFWSHDIREVRNYNKTLAGKEAKSLITQIHEEINAKLEQEDAAASGTWRNCVQQIFTDPVYQTVRMKSAYLSPEITQMTWHPIHKQPTSNLNSPTTIESTLLKHSENNQFQRSVSVPRGAVEQNVNRVKLGTVTRERQLFTKYSHQQTPSPTRKITWNFPFQSNDSRQGRFIISRADIPVGSRRPRRASRKEECTANLYDLHDLVP
ncbi:uncharacterized protein LOC124344625 isoform X1 [Daphnia pulicaria]|uniref:uncharacterized protein LOC124344625 isoform X1 n=2 Tax=Daphnia pulicaria TaxID=35523 RepID=UPI001EE9B194|nr:uncharacterized protein LOC124344625 isoform X1 [Daphnia pulicaria]